MPFSLYIASSFKNFHAVQLLRDLFQAYGFIVYDWTAFTPPLPDDMTPEERRKALDTDERGEIFSFCAEACGRVDLVIYLGQSGQDAGVEVGIAHNAGVPIFGLAGPLERTGLMLSKAVTRWFTDSHTLLEGVAEFANGREADMEGIHDKVA